MNSCYQNFRSVRDGKNNIGEKRSDTGSFRGFIGGLPEGSLCNVRVFCPSYMEIMG